MTRTDEATYLANQWSTQQRFAEFLERLQAALRHGNIDHTMRLSVRWGQPTHAHFAPHRASDLSAIEMEAAGVREAMRAEYDAIPSFDSTPASFTREMLAKLHR